jgi:hypothetical protein
MAVMTRRRVRPRIRTMIILPRMVFSMFNALFKKIDLVYGRCSLTPLLVSTGCLMGTVMISTSTGRFAWRWGWARFSFKRTVFAVTLV